MRKLLPFIIFLATLAATPAANAAEFSLGGYYRLRLLLFQDLTPWQASGEAGDTSTQGLWMHRARLQPKLKFNDNISFHMAINVLDNTVAGDFPELQDAGAATVPEFFSGSVLPNPDYTKNLYVQRAWGEVLTGVGLLRFGRMGSHWGLGILANDGNAPGDDFGDTVDRLMFVTKIGPVYVIPAIDKVSETQFLSTGQVAPGFFDDPTSVGGQADDVDQFILAMRYAGEVHSAGLYAVYRQQPSTDSSAYIFDAWGQTRLGPVNVETEFTFLTGKTISFIPTIPGQFTAQQWGWAVESDMAWRQFLFGLDFGAASGDDADGPTDNDINAFTFDRNYRVALLLFHYIPPYDDAELAISNAWYVRPWARYTLWDDFEFDLVLLHAQALQPAPAFDSRGDYGTELDVTWRYIIKDDFEWTLTYGALVPGSVFDQVETTKPEAIIHGLEGRFLIRF